MRHFGSESELRDREAIALSRVQPELFRVVFERHYDTVWRYLRIRLGASSADDLASETFMRAFAARARYEPRFDSALPWLFGIAGNLIAADRRREARRLRAYARAGLLEQRESVEDDWIGRLAARSQGRALVVALAELRSEDRETLLLSAIGGLTHPEVAEAMGVAEGTIGARLSRARTKLAPALAGLVEHEAAAHG
jgi:RNA polymerase sigma factor (sigma-70 family)